MKVYRIYPDTGCNPHCEDNIESTLQAVETWLSEGDIGMMVTVITEEMSQGQFDALPEYEGP